MTNKQPISSERSAGDDPHTTRLLRAIYSAPQTDSYWAGLEQRVMARIHDAPAMSWWAVLSEWRTAGAIAATIGLLLAGATVVREVSLDRMHREMAARAALEAGMPSDDATFSFGAGRRLPADAPERYLDPFDY
jgi:hypothetical protein